MSRRKKPANEKTPLPRWLAIGLPSAALLISCVSFSLACYQTVQGRKIFRAYVRPDVQCVIRKKIASENGFPTNTLELIMVNSGPIKAVSVGVSYKIYGVNPKTLEILEWAEVKGDLLAFSFLEQELLPGKKVGEEIVEASPMSVYVIDTVYYRDSDMEKTSRQDFFLYDSRTEDDYIGYVMQETIMKNLQTVMRSKSLDPQKLQMVQSHFHQITSTPPAISGK